MLIGAEMWSVNSLDIVKIKEWSSNEIQHQLTDCLFFRYKYNHTSMRLHVRYSFFFFFSKLYLRKNNLKGFESACSQCKRPFCLDGLDEQRFCEACKLWFDEACLREIQTKILRAEEVWNMFSSNAGYTGSIAGLKFGVTTPIIRSRNTGPHGNGSRVVASRRAMNRLAMKKQLKPKQVKLLEILQKELERGAMAENRLVHEERIFFCCPVCKSTPI